VLGTEATLAVMDALGIQGLLFDEYQTTTEDGAPTGRYSAAGVVSITVGGVDRPSRARLSAV
jgi:hypothetical protein